MKRILLLAGLLLLVVVPVQAQTLADTVWTELVRSCGMDKAADTRMTQAMELDTLTDAQRAALINARGWVRGAITQCEKTKALMLRLLEMPPPPIGEPELPDTILPPPDTVPEVPPDTLPPEQPDTAVKFAVVSGSEQVGAPGSTLPEPLIVHVRQGDVPQQGVEVTFNPVDVNSGRLSSGGNVGQFVRTTSQNGRVMRTDSLGQAGVTWHLGTSGQQQVVATFADGLEAYFDAAFPGQQTYPPDALIFGFGPVNVDSPTWVQLRWGDVGIEEGEFVMACGYNTDSSGVIIDKSHVNCPNPPEGPVPVAR